MFDFEPKGVDELSWALTTSGPVNIIGKNSSAHFRTPATAERTLTTQHLTGIIEFSPEDQVVEVYAGTVLGALQDALMQNGQCLPIVGWADGFSPSAFYHSTVGGEIALNLPHYLEAETGSWRDWILGMTVVLADGTVAKSGSHAVKSVAGYDVHRFMVGTRGSLGVIASVILRTTPLASLPAPSVVFMDDATEILPEPTGWIQRVLPADFERASMASRGYDGFDVPNSSTLWRTLPSGKTLPRYPGDWIMRSGCGPENIQVTDGAQVQLMKQAKLTFDPEKKLNPGEWGFM
jgi:FAD/FMN-containing dehydrogenase